MARKNVFSQHTETYVDSNTGEVLECTDFKRGYIPIDNTEHFYMTFIEFLSPWYKLKPESAKVLLMWMCEHAEWDTGCVSLTTIKRKEVCDTLKLSPQTVSNCITALKNAKLIDGEKGEYRINPFLFWKGTRDKIRELLKDATIEATFKIVPKSKVKEQQVENGLEPIEMKNFENE